MSLFSRVQWCSTCIILLLLVGCDVKRPKDIIPESKMEDILYDYHIAQALGENVPYSENYKKVLYTDAVFAKYHTTEAAFDSSLVWYTRNTEVFAKMYERISQRLKKQQESLNHLIAMRDKQAVTSLPGDSIDVWFNQRILMLTGAPLDNKMVFTIVSDSNFKERDTLLWNVRYRFPEGLPEVNRAAVMAMQVKYANDSIISSTKSIRTPGMYNLCLQSDTLGEIKEIKGFIYYPNGKQKAPLLIDHISLMRYHAKVLNDSLATDSLKADSVKNAVRPDSIKRVPRDTIQHEPQRVNPDDMNRRRTNRPIRKTPVVPHQSVQR